MQLHVQTFQSLINSIIVLVFIYGLVFFLKQKGTLKEDHSVIFARTVTDICLPAAIFANLANRSIKWEQISPALLMMSLELACIALAWFVCNLLKFDRNRQGAVVFCSAFGSSTFIGYPIIMEMYGSNSQALSEAILMSEIGVGYPIFILGPLLAIYFGTGKADPKVLVKSLLTFVRSPVFFALLIGVAWNYLELPGRENVFLSPIFQLCNVLESALMMFALMAVGILFDWPSFRNIILPLLVVIVLKLILKPLLAHWLLFDYPDLWRQVALILAAMPPALLGVVFLKRYGGDASLASTLLLAASVASCATIAGVFWFVY